LRAWDAGILCHHEGMKHQARLVQYTVRGLNAIGQPDSAMPTTTVSSLDD